MDTRTLSGVIICFGLAGCAPSQPVDPYVPSMRYADGAMPSRSIHGLAWKGSIVEEKTPEGRAQLRLLTKNEEMPNVAPVIKGEGRGQGAKPHLVAGVDDLSSDVKVIRNTEQLPRAYTGPLELGDPGVGASLWRETRASNEVFRDFRAWQPMDLITIVVNEQSLGRSDADTQVRSKSEYLAAIENFLGLESQTAQWNHPPDLTSVIKASTKNDFISDGLTLRQGQLTAQLSAVVAEVLPSGLLRVEGEKIISVNNEEQVMVISGLVRPRDITSDNQVASSKIAQARIDYYGKGTLGEAQYGGWLSRVLRILWPF